MKIEQTLTDYRPVFEDYLHRQARVADVAARVRVLEGFALVSGSGADEDYPSAFSVSPAGLDTARAELQTAHEEAKANGPELEAHAAWSWQLIERAQGLFARSGVASTQEQYHDSWSERVVGYTHISHPFQLGEEQGGGFARVVMDVIREDDWTGEPEHSNLVEVPGRSNRRREPVPVQNLSVRSVNVVYEEGRDKVRPTDTMPVSFLESRFDEWREYIATSHRIPPHIDKYNVEHLLALDAALAGLEVSALAEQLPAA